MKSNRIDRNYRDCSTCHVPVYLSVVHCASLFLSVTRTGEVIVFMHE